MDRAVTWLDELLNLSLVAKNTFRKRSLQKGLSETSKSPWQPEGTNSLAFEKTPENYAFANKANRSIEITNKNEISISSSTHTILSNSFKKEGCRTRSNERSSVNSFTDSGACFNPSCSRVNLLSEGSNVLKAFAPHEWEAQFAERLSYHHRRRRLQFRTPIPASNKKKLERDKADWFQPINYCTLSQECIPHLYKVSGICDNRTQLLD